MVTGDGRELRPPAREEIIAELRKLRGETFGEIPPSIIRGRYPGLTYLADESGATAVGGDSIRGLLLSAVDDLGPTRLREGAKALFGLTGGSYGKARDARLYMARGCFEPIPSESTFRQQPKYLKLILDQLASSLVNLSLPGAARKARHTLGGPSEISGIRRPQLEAFVLASLQGQRRPVTLWGEGGNGKTFLARQIAAEIAIELEANLPVVLIRRGNQSRAEEQTYQADLIECLNMVEKVTHSWSLAAQEIAVRDLIAHGRSFSAVVLDDVDEASIGRLVPPECFIPVLITSRSRLNIDGPAIRIDAYHDEEALAAIQLLLGSADQGDMRKLCRILGNRPVAIDIGGRMIRQGHATLGELTSALVTDAPITLESSYQLLGENVESSIVRLYTEVYGRLVRRPHAQAIVDALLWLSSGIMPDEMVKGFLGRQLESQAQLIAHAAGLAWLSEIGLVWEQGGAIEINGLSRTLLRWLGHGRIDGILDSFYETLAAAEDSFENDPVPPEPWYAKLRSRSESYTAFLTVYRFALDVVTALFDELLGAGRFSIICIGAHDFLARENDLGVLSEKKRGSRHVIITAEEYGLIAWTSTSLPRIIPTKQAYFVYRTVSLSTRILDWALEPRLDPSVPAVVKMDPDDRFDWFVTPLDDYEHHRIDTYSREYAAANHLDSWALCGRRLDISAERLTGKECPQCCEFRNSRNRLEVLAEIMQQFVFILRDGGRIESREAVFFICARGAILQQMDDAQRAAKEYMFAITVIGLTGGDKAWQLEAVCGVMDRLRQLPIEFQYPARQGLSHLVALGDSIGGADPRVPYHVAWMLAAYGRSDAALAMYDKVLILLQGMDPAERPLAMGTVQRERDETESQTGRS